MPVDCKFFISQRGRLLSFSVWCDRRLVRTIFRDHESETLCLQRPNSPNTLQHRSSSFKLQAIGKRCHVIAFCWEPSIKKQIVFDFTCEIRAEYHSTSARVQCAMLFVVRCSDEASPPSLSCGRQQKLLPSSNSFFTASTMCMTPSIPCYHQKKCCVVAMPTQPQITKNAMPFLSRDSGILWRNR